MCLHPPISGKPDDEDLERIRTRKPEPPMIEVTLQDGSKRQLWCTFGPQQIDLDPFSSSGYPPPGGAKARSTISCSELFRAAQELSVGC